METIIFILVFGLAGTVLLAVNMGYFFVLWDHIFPKQHSPRLGPFEIVGLPEEEAMTLRIALPKMVIARLNLLKNETNSAIVSLQKIQGLHDSKENTPAAPRFVHLPIPDRFSQPIDIDIKIADVELGWLLALFVDKANTRSILNVMISYNSKDQSAKIYVHSLKEGGYSFIVNTSNDINKIVDEIAAKIIQLSAKNQETALHALDAESFVGLVNALSEYAALEHTRAFVGPQLTSYEKILDNISRYVDELKHWKDLQWFAAHVSERAQKWPRALKHYARAQGLTSPVHPDHKILEDKIQHSREQLQVEQDALRVAGDGNAVAKQAALEKSRIRARKSATSPVSEAVAKPIQEIIGLEKLVNTSNIRIGVVGGAPWIDDADTQLVVLLDEVSMNLGDDIIRDYQTEIMQTMRMMAPNSTYVYTSLGSEAGVGGGNSVK